MFLLRRVVAMRAMISPPDHNVVAVTILGDACHIQRRSRCGWGKGSAPVKLEPWSVVAKLRPASRNTRPRGFSGVKRQFGMLASLDGVRRGYFLLFWLISTSGGPASLVNPFEAYCDDPVDDWISAK